MPGRRQHFMPQFLQSGFAVPGGESQSQVWVFHQSHGCYKTNVTNVGVQGKFYTDDDNHDADTVITRAEVDYAELVAALRSGSQSALRDPLISQMLTHFEIRTRQFRENLTQLGQRGILRLLDHLQGESGTERLIAYMRANRSLLRDEVRKRNLPQSLVGVLEACLAREIRRTQGERDKEISMLRPLVTTEIPKIAKTAHIKALLKSTAPPKRSDRLSSLSYDVLRVEDRMLILGDAVVLFRMDGPNQYRNVVQGGDRLLNVYLPLSPSSILIGATEKPASLPPNLNREVARCSLEYFISSENSGENWRLRREIGQSAAFISDEEITEVVEEALPLEG